MYQKNPEKRESLFREWLTYIVFFISGEIIAGDLLTLLYTFLGGELSIRFILKVLTLLIILGMVFSYYLYDLKKKTLKKTSTLWAFESGAILLVSISIIGSFILIGSPNSSTKYSF